jgi:hypothetical protein
MANFKPVVFVHFYAAANKLYLPLAAHGSRVIDRGTSRPEVQSTLGHGNIAATSGYLHRRRPLILQLGVRRSSLSHLAGQAAGWWRPGAW